MIQLHSSRTWYSRATIRTSTAIPMVGSIHVSKRVSKYSRNDCVRPDNLHLM